MQKTAQVIVGAISILAINVQAASEPAPARFSLSASVPAGPILAQQLSTAAGTVAATASVGFASVTAGANEDSIPYIRFAGSTSQRGAASADVSGTMRYYWSIVGEASNDELIPVTISTLGYFSSSLTAFSLLPGRSVNASLDWMTVAVATNFATWGSEGALDSRSYGVFSGNAEFGQSQTLVRKDFEEVSSAPGGSVKTTGTASFSETFTILAQANQINEIALLTRGQETGGGNGTWLSIYEAEYSYSYSGYVDPIITIDAAFADRFRLVQSSIPIVPDTTPVPEPSTFVLALCGLAAISRAIGQRRT